MCTSFQDTAHHEANRRRVGVEPYRGVAWTGKDGRGSDTDELVNVTARYGDPDASWAKIASGGSGIVGLTSPGLFVAFPGFSSNSLVPTDPLGRTTAGTGSTSAEPRVSARGQEKCLLDRAVQQSRGRD